MAVYRRKDTDSKGWYYKFTIDGVTYKKAIPTARTKKQAEDAEREARNDVHNGTYGIKTDILFTKFVKENYVPYAEKHLKRAERLSARTKFLTEFFARYTLRQISPLLIEKFKFEHLKTETIRATKRKASSVNTILFVLSGILTKAVSDGYLKQNPCQKVKLLPVEEIKTRTLSNEEEKRLLEGAGNGPGYLKPLIQLALCLGWRKEEMLHLEKRNVDFSRNLVFVPHAKWSRDPRKTKGVHMSDKVRNLLYELVTESESNYLFVNPKTGLPWSTSFVHDVFKETCEQVGVTGFHFHDLRHTFGTRLGEMNVGVEKIARTMGHSSIKTTMMYVHTSQDTLTNVMEQAAAFSDKQEKESSKIVPLRKRKAS